HRLGERQEDLRRLAGGQRRAVDLLGETATTDILESDEGHILATGPVRADLVNGDDVLVSQLSGGLRLGREATALLVGSLTPATYHLDRRQPPGEQAVSPEKDDAHPAHAQLAGDVVGSDLAQLGRRE